MANRASTWNDLRERFYQSVAETLTLLHTAPGRDRRQVMVEVARTLASILDLPLVWIGRLESGSPQVEVMAAAGPAAEYALALQLSRDEHAHGGMGPSGIALREGHALATSIDAPEFAPWRESARRYGLGSSIVAASGTRDGGQLTISAYAGDGASSPDHELLDWVQRLSNELARFWDDQALLERNLRISRYRDAQRTIQRALLEQPDPQAVYHTLAQALAEIAGAAAVDVLVARDDGGGETLQRMALVGPMAEAMRNLPLPPLSNEIAISITPTLAFMQGMAVIRTRPANHPEMSAAWRVEPLVRMGAIGCWPIFATPRGDAGNTRSPVGVFAIVTRETDSFDIEMCRLLDEIAEATGLALMQHEQHRALLQEQQRQTYLALHDDLTGLPNRRALDSYLERVLAAADQSGRLVAAGLLDMDDLKPINDRHGHAMGDRLLVEVARRLGEAVRAEDYVARLGGDEFVLVLEGLQHEQELAPLLDRVWQALRQPMTVDGTTFELSASLGIALYPTHARTSGEQLLRRADQAMYRAKAHKSERVVWWSLPPSPEAPITLSDERDSCGIPGYGTLSRQLLEPFAEGLESRLPAVVEGFYAELLAHEGAARLLGALPKHDTEAIKQRLLQHLKVLVRPGLDQISHRVHATQSGMFYAASGVEEVWLLEAMDRLRDLFATALGSGLHRDLRPLRVVLQRLGLDRQWQLESMRELQRRRIALLGRLNALAWSADSYLDLIQGTVDILIAHEEIVGCAVGRPDSSGLLTYEAVSGEAFADYLRALAQGQAAPIRVDADSPEGLGPSGRAWRTATIQHSANYASDPTMGSWRDIARRLNIASNVAVPLCPAPYTPAAVLTIYSSHNGGFQSDDQQAFIEQIKTVLDLALVRLAPPRPGTALLPFFVRERWRGLIATDALRMHFQPVVRLASGRITELEALARLRDDDGSLLPPGRFLPALGDDDLIVLFHQGLAQAMACRQALAGAGYTLDMSVNVPATALEDRRYVDTAAEVIATGGCPVEALLFEILESPIGAEQFAAHAVAGMQAFKALGVRLVEDDLGAGYSSLIRLRQWPFDRVKIDQAIVRQIVDDPLRTLRFIRQLIRLGHDLGIEVVVEGLETPGMIEAALILGADLGQGYALAPPMPQAALPDWLAHFRADWDATRPRTALGALAGALLWEEQYAALPTDVVCWKQHAEASCSAGAYLQGGARITDALVEGHARMHAAAFDGPDNPDYRRAQATFLALLIKHVQAEELRAQIEYRPKLATIDANA